MKKILLFSLLTLFSTQAFNNKTSNPIEGWKNSIATLSSKFNISIDALQNAVKVYQQLKLSGQLNNQQFLTIADFSKPSSEKRLFIINMEKMELVFHSLVAHGRNSGKQMAEKFSNKMESFQSSIGFFITGNIYKGKHGMSLQLEGIEAGINDKAKQRAIVVHGADYVNEALIKKQGYIGRSLGCPAVPKNQVKDIIQTIKGSSLFYIHAPDKSYLQKSNLIGS
ncbi:murein L,D-transpeptidase catalytic domain family protein [Sediminibacterium sp. C3]|uniref:murein L,D-transpeptidase catalytic domain family protein n=1 Tax=Sediminibacterium sp. C3 TaxID=1267211 RepID=UPI00041CB373|nr:murein L,D-transpeptidase catalytic domain family protein [Sediminibacterium sp. C3]